MGVDSGGPKESCIRWGGLDPLPQGEGAIWEACHGPLRSILPDPTPIIFQN